MGDEVDDILRGLTLPAAVRDTYEGVRNGFQRFFVVKKNVIYERAQTCTNKETESQWICSLLHYMR